jgi:protein SCO1
MRNFLIFFTCISLLLSSCGKSSNSDSSGAITVTSSNAISDMSIYNLPSVWTTQNDEEIELKDLRGSVLVMVMIYTTC